MNFESQLKLQAYLDGELPASEAREFERLLAADPAAQSLAAELKNTTAALSGNELEMRLPESREFFWSKIERQIERETRTAERQAVPRPRAAWLRYFIPVAGCALAVGIVATSMVTSGPRNLVGEVETSEGVAAYTFRSPAQKMTFVWLEDKPAANLAEATPATSEIQ